MGYVVANNKSQVIQFPHWEYIFMINQLNYCTLETLVQSNVPFIRDALKEVRDIRVGSLKNNSLMGNFMISQPLSIVEVSYQAVQKD